MFDLGKILATIGALLLISGLLMMAGVPVPFGKLPGDIVLKTEHSRLYFPIVSCIVLSLLLTLLSRILFK